MIPQAIAEQLVPLIGQISAIKSLAGGCIASASCVDAAQGRFFLKWGEGDVAQTFTSEAIGLEVLAQTSSSLVIPRVLDVKGGPTGFLLLEWISQGPRQPDFWVAFGHALAEMHKHTGEGYGFSSDNFIGRTPQVNTINTSWPDFFRACRLAPQCALAQRTGRWHQSWDVGYDQLMQRLDTILPLNPPAALQHGDLWGGNFLVTAAGTAALIDPAVYYGHHEADLAMTSLFGGFDDAFYHAYREVMPVERGYAERRDLYNLYHLINHLNLFGDSYAGGVERILKRYA